MAWQQPESRRYFPVARLIAGAGDVEGLYEFAYIKGAEEAATAGFEPFRAFPALTEVYRSKDLFPFFENRLMSVNRPDYANYVQSLGLDSNPDPMLILARSGGTRATDSIELFPLPARTDENGAYHTFFWMHGFRHLNAREQSRVLSLRPGEELLPVAQRDNAVDSNAIQLQTPAHDLLGYLPRYLASEAVSFLNANVGFRVFVERVNPPPAPTQQRLLCRLEATWPNNFQPFATGAYQPIPADATDLHH